MEVILVAALVIVGGLLNFATKLKTRFVYGLATAEICLSLLLAVNSWVFYYTGVGKIAFFAGAFTFLFQWGRLLWYLILGYLMGNILLKLISKEPLFDGYEVKKITRSTLWAVSILAGNMFLISSVGKLENSVYMKGFFISSGYAVWFLYFIIAAEFLGGLGILLHFKLKTGPMAVGGIMLIMAGAVYTHVHNKDPFSDAYAALTQLVTLSLLMTLYYYEKRAAYKPAVVNL
jgi:hypothetical protein